MIALIWVGCILASAFITVYTPIGWLIWIVFLGLAGFLTAKIKNRRKTNPNIIQKNFDNTIKLIHSSYNKKISGQVFPQGEAQLKGVILSLGKVFQVDFRSSNTIVYRHLVDIYYEVYQHHELSENFLRKNKLLKNATQNTMQKAIDFCKQNIENPEYFLAENDYLFFYL